ncbi:MAG: regulatory protein RecX [Candidatus Limnocylindrales bacterium]
MTRAAPTTRRETVAARRERRATVDDPEVVLEAAAAFLAVRPRSIAETRRRLRTHGYRDELIQPVLERLVEYGYLDDEAFGRAWLESRDRAHPRGEMALRRELRQKGLERDTIEGLLRERTDRLAEDAEHAATEPGAGPPGAEPDVAAARRLLERKGRVLAREPDPRKRRARGYALLARHGFDPDTIREALLEGQGDPLIE